jgi:hypothetical protein
VHRSQLRVPHPHATDPRARRTAAAERVDVKSAGQAVVTPVYPRPVRRQHRPQQRKLALQLSRRAPDRARYRWPSMVAIDRYRLTHTAPRQHCGEHGSAKALEEFEETDDCNSGSPSQRELRSRPCCPPFGHSPAGTPRQGAPTARRQAATLRCACSATSFVDNRSTQLQTPWHLRP